MQASAKTRKTDPVQLRKELFLLAAFLIAFGISRLMNWLPEALRAEGYWAMFLWCLFTAPLIAWRLDKKPFAPSFFPKAACLGIMGFVYTMCARHELFFIFHGSFLLFSYAAGNEILTRTKPVKSPWERLLFLMSTPRAVFWYINAFAFALLALPSPKVLTAETVYCLVLALFSTVAIWVTPGKTVPTVTPVPA